MSQVHIDSADCNLILNTIIDRLKMVCYHVDADMLACHKGGYYQSMSLVKTQSDDLTNSCPQEVEYMHMHSFPCKKTSSL